MKREKEKIKRGISLIVLVITIIVIIILATAVIVTILDNTPISSAIRAVDESNVAKYTEQIEQIRAKLLLQNENHELPNLEQMKVALEKEKWVNKTEMIMDDGIEKLKLTTKEGYIFYITADNVEYKGKGEIVDTSALKKDDVIELIAQEETTKGQYVKITSKAEEYYVIKYKIGEEEEKWTEIENGERVEVPYGRTIYAKLFYGSNSGVEFKLKIGELNPSVVAKETDTSNIRRKTDIVLTDLFDITWGSEGTGSIRYEVIGNMLFKNQSYNNTSIENIKELELGTYNVKCIITNPSGNYTTNAQKQVSITTLASTSVINASNTSVSANAIYSKYDLADFRDLVNNNNLSINAKIMEDIDLSNVCSSTVGSWVPIANVAINENLTFNGTFDGNNKTISGLYIDSTDTNQGLFGKNNGEIINIKVSGSITSNKSAIGAIVSWNKNTVYNCHNSVSIKSDGVNSIGGLVGYNECTIENCSNLYSIQGYSNIGGIVGENIGDIKSCYNKAKITALNQTAGGIVGYNISGKIYNCYNVGEINADLNVGGISGAGGGPGISVYTYNSYNLGSIIGNLNISDITGYQNANDGYSNDINCYGNNVTLALLSKGLYSENKWVEDSSNENRGYPILKWQLD